MGRPATPPPRRAADAVPWAMRVAAAWTWRALLLAAGAVLLVRALGEVRLAVVPLAVALLLTTLLAPPAAALRRRGAPAALAALAVLVTFVGVTGGTLALLGPGVAGELDDLGAQVRGGAEEALDRLSVAGVTSEEVDRGLDQVVEQARANAGGIGSGVLNGALVAAEVVAGGLLVVVFTFFLLKDGARMWRWAIGLLEPSRAAAAGELGERLWGKLGAYVRGVVVVALFDAVFIGLALWLIGVPLVLPLAVLTFFAAFIPLVGAVTAGAAAAMVALVSEGVVDALLVVAAVTLVQQLEGDLLYPVVVGRTVALHPVVILLAVSVGAVLGGIIWAFIAVPLVAIVAAVVPLARGRPIDQVLEDGG